MVMSEREAGVAKVLYEFFGGEDADWGRLGPADKEYFSSKARQLIEALNL